MTEPRRARATEAFFGRRKGKPLRERQAGHLAHLLPALRLDLAEPAPADLTTLYFDNFAVFSRQRQQRLLSPSARALIGGADPYQACQALGGTILNVAPVDEAVAPKDLEVSWRPSAEYVAPT